MTDAEFEGVVVVLQITILLKYYPSKAMISSQACKKLLTGVTSVPTVVY